jgi:hypothetical protein
LDKRRDHNAELKFAEILFFVAFEKKIVGSSNDVYSHLVVKKVLFENFINNV